LASREGAIDDRGPLHGNDAFRAYLQDWLDTFDDFKVEPVELIDAGEERVAVQSCDTAATPSRVAWMCPAPPSRSSS
jgi:hypothetical protein